MATERGIRRAAHESLGFLVETLHRCVLHSVDTQSAALAFYALFSLAPALLVVGSVARRFFGEERVHGEIVRQFQGVMGTDSGLAVAAVLEKAAGPGLGAGFAGLAGIVAFVLGATAVFIQLQEALNCVWEVERSPGPMFRSLVRKRIVSFALVVAIGLVLLVSVTISSTLLALTDFLTAEIRLPAALVTLVNEGLAYLVLTTLVALIYRILPDVRLEWRDVAIGAVATSLLFSIGKWLIGFLLGQTTLASQFGVAGALVLILLWVYGASYIVLFGAEMTAVYSGRYRPHPVTPEPGAVSRPVQSSPPEAAARPDRADRVALGGTP